MYIFKIRFYLFNDSTIFVFGLYSDVKDMKEKKLFSVESMKFKLLGMLCNNSKCL